MTSPNVLISNIFFAPYTYGGATIVAEEVARQLAMRHGWHISVLSAVSRHDLPVYSIRKLQVGDIANYVINLPDHRSFSQMHSNPEVTEVANRLIATLQPDLVHLHCIQELGTGLVQAARLANVPTIVSTHDFWWICERQFMIRSDGRYCGQHPVNIDKCQSCVVDMTRSRSRFKQLQDDASFVDLMTFPSHFARDLCLSSGLAPRSHAIWDNGVTLPGKDFFSRQEKRREKDNTLVFAYCGGPSDIKGWPQIRRAFKQLGREDFRVQLADGSPDGSWWKSIDLSDLPGQWEVCARYGQSDMDNFWVGVDVLLFPSQWKETFGLTIREALSRGIRVIQTDSGGTIEHNGPDRDRKLSIGNHTKALRDEIIHALSRVDRHAEAIPVTSFSQQADEFVSLATPFLSPESLSPETAALSTCRRPSKAS